MFILSGCFFASYFKNARTIIMALYVLPTIAGASILWKMPRTNKIGCLFGYYIVSCLRQFLSQVSLAGELTMIPQ